jgi:outer membrane lipoprotein-sorting protein
MTKRIGLWVLAGWLVSLTGAVIWADDLATVEKDLTRAWDKTKSMTAKITMTTNMDMGGKPLESKGDGTLEMLHKGDKIYMRMELKTTMPQPVGATATEQSMLTILDGEYAWTLSETMGQKMAMKTKPDARMMGDPKSTFAELRKDHELKLLPDETVDGTKVYVIEATPKDTGGTPSKTLLYFGKDHGMLVKTLVQNPEGKPTMTMTYTDIKYDVDINPDRFVFKPPPGVEVQDLTKLAPPEPAKPQ